MTPAAMSTPSGTGHILFTGTTFKDTNVISGQPQPEDHVVFSDDFQDPAQSQNNWAISQNGGSIHFYDGCMSISSDPPDFNLSQYLAGRHYDQTSLPHVKLRLDPFPVSADWTLQTTIKFTKIGEPNSDGLSVVCPDGAALFTFQEINSQEHATLLGKSVWTDTTRFSLHRVELQKQGNRVYLGVDGLLVANAPMLALTPDAVQFGGTPVHNGRSWNNFEVYSVEVTERDLAQLLPPPRTIPNQSYGPNLIVNGNLEEGNTGFSTSYQYSPTNIKLRGTYDIIRNPNTADSYAASFSDHTSGSGFIMAVNGSPTGNEPVWTQTVGVEPGQRYLLSSWAANWGYIYLPKVVPVVRQPTAPSTLMFSVNGTTVGTLTTSFIIDGFWTSFTGTWDSGSSVSATISVVDTTVVDGIGNNFALDDLCLCKVRE